MGRYRRVRDEDLYEPADSLYEPVGDLYEPVEDECEPVDEGYELAAPASPEEARQLYSRMSREELMLEVDRLLALIEDVKAERRRAERMCLSAPEWARRELWARIDELRARERRLRLALRYAMMNYAAQCDRDCGHCKLEELCERMVRRG